MAEILDDQIKNEILQIFEQLNFPAHILFFGRKTDCETCPETRQLVEEVTALSDKLSLAIVDLDVDKATAQQFHVDKAPTIVVAGWENEKSVDYGIRFAGIPSGHEFSTLIHDLVLVSSRDSGLSASARGYLQALTTPVHLQVFVTPT